MNILENSKIYQLQIDYVNGTGEHGVVHKKYAEILEQYKKLYAECPIFDATGLMNLYMTEEDFLKNGVIVDIILIALSILGFIGRIVWCIIAFIAAIVKLFQKEMERPSEDDAYNNLSRAIENNRISIKSGWWMGIPIIVVSLVVSSLFAPVSGYAILIKWIWVTYSMPLIIDLFKNVNAWKIAPKKAYAENKKKVLKMQQAEVHLEEIREQLRLLISELQKEYREELNKAVNGIDSLERQSVIQQYSELPKHFWWETNPSQILEKQMYQESIRESFMTSHEVAAIERRLGNEFKYAGTNYAPMYSEQLTEKEMNRIYQRNIQLVKDKGGVILDFVDCVKFSKFVKESEVVKDHEYAEDSISRAVKTDQWNSLGTDIDKAHSYGALTNGEYGSLRNRYDNLDSDVRESINRKVEVGQHVETFNKLRIFARYEWTGQALLLPDTNISGGYVLLDYRCRPEYEFENLEKMKSINPITQIFADYALGRQEVIANVQRMIIKGNMASGRGHAKQKNDTTQVLSIISIVLPLCFNIPLMPVVGIILGIISRKKGGGKLAIIGIVINILVFIVQMFIFCILLSFR